MAVVLGSMSRGRLADPGAPPATEPGAGGPDHGAGGRQGLRRGVPGLGWRPLKGSFKGDTRRYWCRYRYRYGYRFGYGCSCELGFLSKGSNRAPLRGLGVEKRQV